MSEQWGPFSPWPRLGWCHKESFEWAEGMLSGQPWRIRSLVLSEFSRRAASSTAKNATRSANIYVRNVVAALRQIRARYPFRTLSQLNRDDTRKALAEDISYATRGIVCEMAPSGDYLADLLATHNKLCHFVAGRGIEPVTVADMDDPDQHASALESACARMMCAEWVHRRLNRLRDRCVEHINLAAGMVGKRSPYVSAEALKEWQSRQRQGMAWMEQTEIESDCGDLLSLADVAMASVSNPEIRRVELMVRLRGLEALADDAGMVGVMVTLTCPSKFHPSSRKWGNCSPREAQDHLNTVWKSTRKRWDEKKVTVKFCRVAEPHKDGCPHWHMLVFFDPSQKATALQLFKKEALRVDGDEKGASVRRFKVENIDPAKGSAVGYISKYISKNINGAKMDEKDKGSGKSAEEGAIRARAWASRWGIRQFQFGGEVGSVTLWREARRLKDAELPDQVAPLRDAACSSRWAEFVGLALELAAETDKALDEKENAYGERPIRIVGIRAGGAVWPTRCKRWALKKRGSVSPWSTTNNCPNPLAGGDLDTHVSLLGLGPEARAWLEMGRVVTARHGERAFVLRGGQLREFD